MQGNSLPIGTVIVNNAYYFNSLHGEVYAPGDYKAIILGFKHPHYIAKTIDKGKICILSLYLLAEKFDYCSLIDFLGTAVAPEESDTKT